MLKDLTEEQKQTLLDNPELCMFYATEFTKPVPKSLLMFIPIVLYVIVAAMLIISGFATNHAVVGTLINLVFLIGAFTAAIAIRVHQQDSFYKGMKESHYIDQLKQYLDEDGYKYYKIKITSVIYEKAEGYAMFFGEEKPFSYSSYSNVFRIEPDTDLVEIYDGKGFWAMVRRDPETESLYQKEEA